MHVGCNCDLFELHVSWNSDIFSFTWGATKICSVTRGLQLQCLQLHVGWNYNISSYTWVATKNFCGYIWFLFSCTRVVTTNFLVANVLRLIFHVTCLLVSSTSGAKLKSIERNWFVCPASSIVHEKKRPINLKPNKTKHIRPVVHVIDQDPLKIKELIDWQARNQVDWELLIRSRLTQARPICMYCLDFCICFICSIQI